MQPSEDPAQRERILAALRRRAGASEVLRFDAFMEVALYEPGSGYYTRSRPRIGTAPGTDFVTATTSSLFGRLVAAAAAGLLGGENPGEYTFVEIGAESGRGVLDGVAHPFRSVAKVGIGQSLALSGPSVVFSNELFDAQPFRRFRREKGAWREIGVHVGETELTETLLETALPLPDFLPANAPDGYVIDAPIAAAALAGRIASLPWTGLFLAFDYGKPWQEITGAAPEGTARAYRHHAQSNDLLANPGDQDLTCHICWDWISEALRDAGFGSPVLESQEAFFVHHAAAFLASVMEAEAGRMSPDKLSLLQLIHPSHMGQRFQALWALRR